MLNATNTFNAVWAYQRQSLFVACGFFLRGITSFQICRGDYTTTVHENKKATPEGRLDLLRPGDQHHEFSCVRHQEPCEQSPHRELLHAVTTRNMEQFSDDVQNRACGEG